MQRVLTKEQKHMFVYVCCGSCVTLFMGVHPCVGVSTGAAAIWQMLILDKEILPGSFWLHSASTQLINTYAFQKHMIHYCCCTRDTTTTRSDHWPFLYRQPSNEM